MLRKTVTANHGTTDAAATKAAEKIDTGNLSERTAAALAAADALDSAQVESDKIKNARAKAAARTGVPASFSGCIC